MRAPVITLLVCVAVQSATARAASLEWLSPEPDYGFAQAHDISGDGAAVVGECSASTASGRTEACWWRPATGWLGLGYLPGHDISAATSISSHGNVVVGESFSTTTQERRAFRWTRTDGMRSLDLLANTNSNRADAVSANGSVVVGISGARPFRWTESSGVQELDRLPGYTSLEIFDISENGNAVVGRAYNNPWSRFQDMQAFRWTQAGGMRGLGYLPSPSDHGSSARAASADGSVVVGTSSRYQLYDGPIDQAVVWRRSCGCMRGLGFLPDGFTSKANDVSADGTVIVGSSHQGGGGFRAVVWTARGGLQKLEDILEAKGVDVTRSLASADKVSADGRWILGHSGFDTFLASIGPDIVGTRGPDRLMGTPGDDSIDGMGGADVMTGLAGNDTYFVDVVNDVVVEAENEGTDTVNASATYALPANVEKLILTGTSEIDGSGNALDNTLAGNSAKNVLNGKAGDDIIRAGRGEDWLIGGLGGDTLTGGPGRDRFVLNTALGNTNIDTITDFTPGEDVMRLGNEVFAELPGLGTLAESAFVTGTIATNAAHRILYDTATGEVRYDADGTGRIVAVHFVSLPTKPALTSSDFYVQQQN